MTATWTPDVLRDGFAQTTIELPDAAAGAASGVATLVRSLPTLGDAQAGPFRHVDVLHMHGWSDYVSQQEVARFWTGRAAALVLDSPWLELRLGAVSREMLAPLVGARARFAPSGQHPAVDFVDGAVHDVFPSHDEPRRRAFDTLRAWMPLALSRAG